MRLVQDPGLGTRGQTVSVYFDGMLHLEHGMPPRRGIFTSHRGPKKGELLAERYAPVNWLLDGVTDHPFFAKFLEGSPFKEPGQGVEDITEEQVIRVLTDSGRHVPFGIDQVLMANILHHTKDPAIFRKIGDVAFNYGDPGKARLDALLLGNPGAVLAQTPHFMKEFNNILEPSEVEFNDQGSIQRNRYLYPLASFDEDFTNFILRSTPRAFLAYRGKKGIMRHVTTHSQTPFDHILEDMNTYFDVGFTWEEQLDNTVRITGPDLEGVNLGRYVFLARTQSLLPSANGSPVLELETMLSPKEREHFVELPYSTHFDAEKRQGLDIAFYCERDIVVPDPTGNPVRVLRAGQFYGTAASFDHFYYDKPGRVARFIGGMVRASMSNSIIEANRQLSQELRERSADQARLFREVIDTSLAEQRARFDSELQQRIASGVRHGLANLKNRVGTEEEEPMYNAVAQNVLFMHQLAKAAPESVADKYITSLKEQFMLFCLDTLPKDDSAAIKEIEEGLLLAMNALVYASPKDAIEAEEALRASLDAELASSPYRLGIEMCFAPVRAHSEGSSIVPVIDHLIDELSAQVGAYRFKAHSVLTDAIDRLLTETDLYDRSEVSYTINVDPSIALLANETEVRRIFYDTLNNSLLACSEVSGERPELKINAYAFSALEEMDREIFSTYFPDATEPELVIEFIDNGYGLTEKVAEDQMYNVNSSGDIRSTSSKGAEGNQGISILRKFVDNFDGFYELRSLDPETKRGAMVRFYLGTTTAKYAATLDQIK